MTTFLLEVGTEELPADFVDDALKQWQKIPKTLEELSLSVESVELYGTPRRLAIVIKGLPSQQPDRTEEVKGPPAQAAFKEGKPTPAAEGFARKQGVSLEELTLRPTEKGEFVFVNKKTPGRPIGEILQELAPLWITQLEGRRFMRWSDGDLRFPRPIRTLVALLDQEVLPLELVNGSSTIKSDRVSLGHRVLHPQPITITEGGEYVESLRSKYIEVDPVQRNLIISQQINTLAQELKAVAEVPADLLTEVTNLVEWPTAVVGNFDEEFLSLPPEVITTVMVTHQRYFPLKDQEGKLLSKFITIANGDPSKAEIIAAGNARVIRARLADAQFFYKADCDDHLESYLPELETVIFQEELGTMRDKVDRLLDITQQIGEQLNLDSQTKADLESTALLCKADLVTQMVYEFPELQGVMGEKYALVSGESPAVAKGIFEHYLPRNAEDSLPETIIGQVVGIADRLDTLVSIFGLGMKPTGSSDPFALRRAANAIVNIIWSGQLGINLQDLIAQSAEDFLTGHPNFESPLIPVQEFFIDRIRTLLKDELKIDYDLVNAILGDNDQEYSERALKDLLDVRDRALFLHQIRNNQQLQTIYETVNRSTRLAAQGDLDTQQLEPEAIIQMGLFEKSCESAFYQGLVELVPLTESACQQRNYQLLVDGLAKIAPVVSNFFDGADSVLVMDKNPQIKQNRLNLLGLLRNHSRVLADFGQIVKS